MLSPAAAPTVAAADAGAAPAVLVEGTEAPAGGDPEAEARRAAAEQARESGQPVEVSRDATTIERINPDGTTTVEISEAPVRTLQDGEYVDIDPSLVDDGAVLVPRATDANVAISDGAGEEPLATVRDGSRSLSLDWKADLAAPALQDEQATFDAGAARDVEVTATNGGFRVHVVLQEAPTKAPVYRLPLTTTGVAVSKTGSGAFAAVDSAGKPVFWIAPPIMWDATQEGLEAGPERTVSVDAALESTTDGGQELVLRPSMAFLTDPSTVYPVRIDPDTYTDDSSDRTTFVSTSDPLRGFPYTSYMRVGYDTTWERNRAFIQHETEDFRGTVVDAQLKLYQYAAKTCTPTPVTVYAVKDEWRAQDHSGASGPMAGVWWKSPTGSSTGPHSQPGVRTDEKYQVTESFNHGFSGSCPNKHETIDVTKIVQAWDEDVIPNYGLALRASDTETSGYKSFCSKNTTSGTSCSSVSNVPTLIVRYNTPPSIVTAMSIVDPGAAWTVGAARSVLTNLYQDSGHLAA